MGPCLGVVGDWRRSQRDAGVAATLRFTSEPLHVLLLDEDRGTSERLPDWKQPHASLLSLHFPHTHSKAVIKGNSQDSRHLVSTLRQHNEAGRTCNWSLRYCPSLNNSVALLVKGSCKRRQREPAASCSMDASWSSAPQWRLMAAHWLCGADEPHTSNPTGHTPSNAHKRRRLNARILLMVNKWRPQLGQTGCISEGTRGISRTFLLQDG